MLPARTGTFNSFWQVADLASLAEEDPVLDPSRCQRRMVFGFARSTTFCQPRTIRESKTIKPRSRGLDTGHLTLQVVTISYWPIGAFSAMN